jgi:hypothetical protein
MIDQEKVDFLKSIGWKEVPGETEEMVWKAPITFTGTPHYFSLDDAYDLEVNGEGIYEYSADDVQTEELHIEDMRRMFEEEMLRFSKTGTHLGESPNY